MKCFIPVARKAPANASVCGKEEKNKCSLYMCATRGGWPNPSTICHSPGQGERATISMPFKSNQRTLATVSRGWGSAHRGRYKFRKIAFVLWAPFFRLPVASARSGGKPELCFFRRHWDRGPSNGSRGMVNRDQARAASLPSTAAEANLCERRERAAEGRASRRTHSKVITTVGPLFIVAGGSCPLSNSLRARSLFCALIPRPPIHSEHNDYIAIAARVFSVCPSRAAAAAGSTAGKGAALM